MSIPRSLRLLPGEAVLATVETDYRAMTNMIFGEAPAFGEILTHLQALEEQINDQR